MKIVVFKKIYKIAFYIAENIHSNIRQLEGAVNKLCAYCKLLNTPITEELVSKTLREMFNLIPREKVTIEQILKQVALVFKVRISDIKGTMRQKEIALARQVAMYLSKELVDESLAMLGMSFGKTHSTILHAHKTVTDKMSNDENLRRHIAMVRRNLVEL